MSDELLIRHCAPTLASIKTGNLFSCPFETREELNASIRRLNRRLFNKGLRVLPLRYRNGSALIYVYRPSKLSDDLCNQSVCTILRQCGYSCESTGCCIRRLIGRLSEEDFPHEIGLFLGYPPEDVYGFIYHRNRVKCSGLWKVYGDVDSAMRTFERYKKCSDIYLKLWSEGRSVEQLTVAV